MGGGEGSSNTIGKDCVTETGEHDSCSNCGFSCIHFSPFLKVTLDESRI